MLLGGTRFVPVNDVDEFPGILVQPKLELPLVVDDQLGRRIQNAPALVLVLIVQVEFAARQVVRDGLGVRIGFTEANLTVGDKANLPPRGGRKQPNVTDVVTERPRNRDPTDRISSWSEH